MNEEQLQELSVKYLNGTATPEERELLLSWYRNLDHEVKWPASGEHEPNQIRDRVLANLRRHIHEGQKNSRHIGRWLAAASILLICSLGIIERNAIQNLIFPIKQQYAFTNFGERELVTLSDSTKIWLASGSRLQYPDHFRGKTREISFSGEAFFEVAKDKAHPFIIHSGNITTKVLGTTFDLSAYKEQKQITVTLLTGKVSFTNGHKTVTILPNQRAIYQKASGNLSKEDYPAAQQMLARRDGNYEYDDLPVTEILEDLRRNYNLDIRIDGPVGNCLFYGRIKQDEDPEKFLRKLCLVMNATLKREGDAFTIRGGGCP